MKPPNQLSCSKMFVMSAIAALVLMYPASGCADECMATLKDPQGSVKVLRYGKLVATLKGGEHFLVKPMPDGWIVYLKSGCDGFIEKKVALQLLPNEPLMKLNYDPEKAEWQKLQSDRNPKRYDASSAKEHGVNYFQLLTSASNGDLKAMARFFSLGRFMDASAADEYYPERWVLLHVVGDERFARFVSTQPAKVRENIAVTFSSQGDTEPISQPKPYLKRYFPKTYKLLFSNES